MRILFTTDVHGHMDVYKAFAEKLKDFDIGVLAGDLMEEFIPLDDAIIYNLKDKDLIEELHDENYDEVKELDKAIRKALHDRTSINRVGLERKREEIIGILESAQRNIYYIRGNHDIADWGNTKYLTNIENRKIVFDELSIYGIKDEFRLAVSKFRFSNKVADNVDRKTILVCHSPPYKIMDTTKMVRRKDHRIILDHVGSKKILKLINKKHPMFCLCGHVHEGIGIYGSIVNGGCYRHRKFIAIDTETKEIRYVEY